MLPESEPWAERSRRLLEAAQAGHSPALGELLELFGDYLRSIAAQEIPGALRAKVNPSDVVQDTFLEASRQFAQFSSCQAEELRLWLRAILLNKLRELRDHYFGVEKRQVGREQSLGDSPSGQPLLQGLAGPNVTPSGQAVRHEEEAQVRELLARLPDDYRLALLWRNWEGLSFAEIGRRLERSEDAARMLYVRALERFQEEMGVDDATRPGTG